jgi:phosphoribosylglycinamide formyltransferase 1
MNYLMKNISQNNMKKSKPFRVVVLSSTRGTDFGAMLAEQAKGKLKNVEFVGLVSDKDCLAMDRAEAANVPGFIIHSEISNFHECLLKTVKELSPDLICLVGWMKILRADFCAEFKNKILNVHPSLLPKYGGIMDYSVHAEVLKNRETETGMTIHLVTAEVDAGPIICQKSVKVDSEDTPESLKEKVQVLEKKWYPEVIRWFRDGLLVFGD